MVLNNVIVICVESASKKEVNVNTNFGTNSTTCQYYISQSEWQTSSISIIGSESCLYLLNFLVSLGVRGSTVRQTIHTKTSMTIKVLKNPKRIQRLTDLISSLFNLFEWTQIRFNLQVLIQAVPRNICRYPNAKQDRDQVAKLQSYCGVDFYDSFQGVEYYSNDDHVTTNKYQVIRVRTGCLNDRVISTVNINNLGRYYQDQCDCCESKDTQSNSNIYLNE